MEPTNIRFGGGSAATVLHPLVGVVVLATIALIFLLPRKYVLVPLLSTAILVPFGQVVVVGGIHFTVYRILVLFGLVRLMTTRPTPGMSRLAGGLNGIDRVFVLWAVFLAIVFSVEWMDMQAVIRSLGTLLDAVGGYLVLRFLIHDMEDIQRAIKVFAIVAVVLAVCMTNEQLTHTNVFGLLGGTPVSVAVRDGQARSCGPFEVYITAGVFGATLVPLFVWLWKGAQSRMLAAFGIIASTIITLTSSSSTPQLAYVAGIISLCFWPLRQHMRAFRWTLVLLLTGLHLAMKAPVWALIARIDLTGSSSGYHRFMLVDSCIGHFSDWWLLGFKNYDEWGWDMWDLSNQYVAYALTGGLVTLALFIAVICKAFGLLGRARRLADDNAEGWFFWCLCAALVSHVVSYFGVLYFDQMQFVWFALLAIISAAGVAVASSTVPESAALAVSGYQAEPTVSWDMT